MPNWCKNKLSIFSESDEQMEEFLEFIRDGDNLFSLDKIMPMPEELQTVMSPTKIATSEEIEEYKEKYKDDNVNILNQKVKNVDFKNNTLSFSNYEDLTYDRLLIATGSKNRELHFMSNLFVLQ